MQSPNGVEAFYKLNLPVQGEYTCTGIAVTPGLECHGNFNVTRLDMTFGKLIVLQTCITFTLRYTGIQVNGGNYSFKK